MGFWLGYALGSSKGGRRAAADFGDAIAPIICFILVIAIIAAVIALPITMIVGASKLISEGWTEQASNLITTAAFAVVPGLFLGWLAALIVIPEYISPFPNDGRGYWRRDDDYEEKKRAHRKVALIATPISLAVGFCLALMGHFIVTGIMAGSFVMAGVLLIIAAVLAIPFTAFFIFAMMNS